MWKIVWNFKWFLELKEPYETTCETSLYYMEKHATPWNTLWKKKPEVNSALWKKNVKLQDVFFFGKGPETHVIKPVKHLLIVKKKMWNYKTFFFGKGPETHVIKPVKHLLIVTNGTSPCETPCDIHKKAR